MALYLVWLRYSAVFFWSITALNFFVIIMYMTGDPKEQDNFRLNEFQSVLQAFTILNASGKRVKMIIVFFTSMVGVVALVMNFIFKYSSKFKTHTH